MMKIDTMYNLIYIMTNAKYTLCFNSWIAIEQQHQDIIDNIAYRNKMAWKDTYDVTGILV